MAQQSPKSKRCAVCGKAYTPRNSFQRACNIPCAKEYARTRRIAAEEKEQRKEIRQRKEALKSLRELESDAQQAFNRYISVRDANQPCISCGITYGQFHAGHYRTTKAARQLRYNTQNCHRQCAQCNNHKSGSITEYRLSLIHKIGEEAVNRLEANNDVVQWDKDYVRRLKKIFAKRARHLERLRER
jgi:5-methylcytosine-specific restriction endonuclease McrA